MNGEVESLLDELRNSLSPLPPSLTSESQGSDLFEAYNFSLIVEAARSENARVHFENVYGARADAFHFRTSPGHIYSTRWPYTHAVLEFPGKDPVEAHIGVRVVGKSQVLHECDIAVIDRQEAVACRRQRREPASSKLLLAVEAKFYASTLGIDLGRSFIGLASDLSSRYTCFVANSTSASVARLLAHYRTRDWYDRVTVEGTSARRLRSFYETVMHNYQAR